MFAIGFTRRAGRPFVVAVVCAVAAVVAPAAQAFNPQPEPPGRAVLTAQLLTPGLINGFNPQPDPPGRVLGIGSGFGLGSGQS